MAKKCKIAVGASSFAAADQEALDLLRRHNCEVALNPYGRKLTESETTGFITNADGLLAGLEPLNRKVLHEVRGSLRAIARIGIGLDNIDLPAAAEFGIKVSNTPEGPAQGVAEMTVAALLAICRRLIWVNQGLHDRFWLKQMGKSIDGLKILLVGYGNIGRRAASLLEAVGAEIIIFDPAFPEISVASLEDGLAGAEVVSLHAAGNRQIIGEREISQMRDGVILLNSARGGLVDEEALCHALKSGKVSACWLDVFSEEPYTGELCECENALLTPHLSTYTDKCRRDMELQAVKNLLRDLDVV